MSKPTTVAAFSLGLLMMTSAAWAQKCEKSEEPTVNISIANGSLSYSSAEGEVRPTICRGNLFTISVDWTDNTVQRIRLHGFRPLLPGRKRWNVLDNTASPDLWVNRHLLLTRRCEAPCSASTIYNLPSSWRWASNEPVNVRSILMTVEMTLADDTVVSFETTWGERP